MICFKILECAEYHNINNEIVDYIKTTGILETSKIFWNEVNTVEFVVANPLFQKWALAHNLRIRNVAVTIGLKIDCCGIHVDTPPAVNKLSWPVLNTSNTFNRWFQPCVDHPAVKINYLGGTAYLDATQLIEIDRMEVTQPCIINAGIPHDVWFAEPAVFPRIGLQCMLFHEPVL